MTLENEKLVLEEILNLFKNPVAKWGYDNYIHTWYSYTYRGKGKMDAFFIWARHVLGCVMWEV